MRFSTQVEKNDEGLSMIADAARRFDEGHFMEALLQNKVTIEEVTKCTIMVQSARVKLAAESLRLRLFAEDFICQYATDDNKCFETAERIFNRIRSTISYSKKIYKRFCKRSHRQLPDGRRPSVFKRSALAAACYNGQLFGLETYDKEVQTLYREMEDFFTDLLNCLLLCHEVIKEEQRIRRSPDACMSIFASCYERVVKETAGLMRSLADGSTEPKSEVAQRRSQTSSLQEFVCNEYHNCTRAQFFDFVVVTQLQEGRRRGMTEVESLLFGVGAEALAERARYVVAHFDELEPEGQKGKLDAKWVAALMLWCHVGVNDNKGKLFVERYFETSYAGRYEVPKMSAVNSAKNRLYLADGQADLEACHHKIEEMLGSGFRLAQQKEEEKGLSFGL